MPPNYHVRGLLHHDAARATPGFTLYTPSGMPYVRLINMKGEEVHQWTIPTAPGNYGYLLENGNLLIGVRTFDGVEGLPAKGGRLMELDWDSNVVWEHVDHNQHHDFRRLPNGNTVYLSWRLLDKDEEARVIGGLPGSEHADGMYCDVIREVSPAGEIVWEWDAARDEEIEKYPLMQGSWRKEFAHGNTVAPCANGDLIINQRMTGLMAIIDKQTKKFKWTMQDPEFGQQHDVQELSNGNLLFFANGATLAGFHGPETGSRVIELDRATKEIVWEYGSTPANAFFSWFVSGCQRLASGNTLICEGVWGRFFEVTPDGDIVWDFAQPNKIDNPKAPYHGGYTTFRCYRYGADSPQIQGRLGEAD